MLKYNLPMNKTSLTKLMILTVLISFPFQFAFSATTTELQRQLQQKQKELDANQDAVANKASEAKTISGQITNLNSDIKSTEQKIVQTDGEISSTSQSIDGLTKSIEAKNQELAVLKKKLNSAIVEVYRFSSRSNLDLMLGSETLGVNSNESNYIEAVQIQIKSMHKQVSDAKQELEKNKSELVAKQNELNDLKSRQVSYKSGIEYQKSQKDKLLGMTIQQKADYEAKVKQLKTEITHISSDLYAARARQRGREVLTGGGSGYPYSSIDEPDAWGFLTRECTSYAAWYMNVVNGKDFVNTRPGSGSAYNWPNLARDQGFTVSSTPKRGAIISWSAGSLTSQWGHVAVVEAVNGDGTIDLSEYNWVRYSYSYRKNVNPGDYGSYSYIY
jgi:surface antigen